MAFIIEGFMHPYLTEKLKKTVFWNVQITAIYGGVLREKYGSRGAVKGRQ
jgi:hypothetical protein